MSSMFNNDASSMNAITNRVSTRVKLKIEYDKQLRDEQELSQYKKTIQEREYHANILQQFYSSLESTYTQEEFSLDEDILPKTNANNHTILSTNNTNKRLRNTNESTDKKDNKSTSINKRSKVQLCIPVYTPPYRKLQQNLYKAPLQRPNFSIDDDDIPLCVCNPSEQEQGGCDDTCQNRLLYMYVHAIVYYTYITIIYVHICTYMLYHFVKVIFAIYYYLYYLLGNVSQVNVLHCWLEIIV